MRTGVAVTLGSGAARLFFYPTLLYTLVRERLPGSQRPWFHRIDRAMLLGVLPLQARSHMLVEEENVHRVLTLNEEYETCFLCCSAQEWEAMGVEQLRLSTVDLTGVPTLENLQRGVEFVLKHRECGNSVYVHCKAGRSRSIFNSAVPVEPSGSNRSHCQAPSSHPCLPQAGPGPGKISQECDC
ncbi:cytochrome P450 26B1 [Platysternon megacephalum]|uniref:Cytochrome P450 26B1 n=1 Tax=Platysternon megacephalum TaxID=55544 RepID=A0A4D9ECC2_9SAUR|nr:cytochrome P450 26B1 [Platysternon megacephalum]